MKKETNPRTSSNPLLGKHFVSSIPVVERSGNSPSEVESYKVSEELQASAYESDRFNNMQHRRKAKAFPPELHNVTT